MKSQDTADRTTRVWLGIPRPTLRRPHDNDDGRVNGEDEEEGDTEENSDVVHGEGGVGTSWKHVGGETLDVLGIKLYRYFM